VSTRPKVRAALRRMKPYHPPLEGRGRGLRLDFNENTAGAPGAACRALAALDPARLSMYPEYGDATREIASYFGVRPDELLLTNGTDEALHLAVDGFADPGDTVLVLKPTYAMYRFYAERAGARVRAVAYGRDFAFPTARLLRALRDRPRVIFIANPNNPTGTLASPEDLRALLEAAPRTLIVVDEAYADYAGMTVLPWIRRYPNLLVTRTFSKALGLASLRIGCLFGDAATVASLARAHSPYSVSTAALVAARAVIADPGRVAREATEVRAARQTLMAALDRLGIRAFPSAGNFVLVDVGPKAGALIRALAARAILVRDRRADFARPGFVRITVGTRAQTRRLIRTLEELWPVR
jgi:histidinol-phosphate aminotransferase